MGKRQFTEEEEEEVARRYLKGESEAGLVAEYGVGRRQIAAILNRRRVVRRTQGEANRLAQAANNPGPARLRAMYHGADQPSMSAIASALGVSGSTVCRWLMDADIPIRSRGEQRKCDLAHGRVLAVAHYCTPEQQAEMARCAREAVSPESRARGLAACNTPEARAKANAATMRQIVRPCAWCGCPVSRTRSRAQQHTQATCGLAHNGEWARHRRWHPNAPRPLILQQITEAIAQHRAEGGEVHRTLPAKVGAPLGATDAEYDAWWSALDLDSLNDYEMTAYLDWDLDRKIREAGLQSGVSEG